MTESSDAADGALLGWAVVANVAEQTNHGADGDLKTSGTRHFSPGTKVWILPAEWGDGWDDALLVGRHRGSRRYVQMVVPLRHLREFRVEGVYSRAVMRELTKPWDSERGRPLQWSSRAEAQEVIATHPSTVRFLR